jgi:serine/threonine protein kinase
MATPAHQSWEQATISSIPLGQEEEEEDDDDDEEEDDHQVVLPRLELATPAHQSWKEQQATISTIPALPLPLELLKEEESWSITKKDMPLSSEAAIRVMDHAHVVLQKRLSEYEYSCGSDSGNGNGDGLDIFRFETSLARFLNSEIELGKRLAWGNFADIYVIRSFRQPPRLLHPPDNDNDTDADTDTDNSTSTASKRKACTPEQQEAAEHIQRTFSAEDLVIKVLRPQLLGNTALYATGAADILTEGTLLAALHHPHIVSIHGRSLASVEGFASGKRDSFFLVLERLQCNLLDRLNEWQQRSSSNYYRTILTNGGVRGRRDARAILLRERVEVMTELADAMSYLHDQRIIHRDLKLTNVGMDYQGRVKLVDFGLAKILPPTTRRRMHHPRGDDDDGKETFQLTGNTGSVRYMAPEIGRGERYNLKADVFSFGILLFEVLNLDKVWNGLPPQEIRLKVHHQKQRPRISMFWPAPLRDLLKSTWSDLPAGRLSMKHVHSILAKQAKEMAAAAAEQ